MSDPSARTHTNDNAPVRTGTYELSQAKREIARLHDSISMLESLPGNELVADLREDRDRWQRIFNASEAENKELRERSEKAEAALDDIVTATTLPGDHCELNDAIWAARMLLEEEKR